MRPRPDCAGCGHTHEAHTHYRGGTECSDRVVRDFTELGPLATPCPCVRYRRPILAPLLRRLLR